MTKFVTSRSADKPRTYTYTRERIISIIYINIVLLSVLVTVILLIVVPVLTRRILSIVVLILTTKTIPKTVYF